MLSDVAFYGDSILTSYKLENMLCIISDPGSWQQPSLPSLRLEFMRT